jgi:hypothetical protein
MCALPYRDAVSHTSFAILRWSELKNARCLNVGSPRLHHATVTPRLFRRTGQQGAALLTFLGKSHIY